MRLTVSHVSTYRYAHPVRGVVQSHRLTPSRFDGQKLIEWKIAMSDGAMGGGFRDGAGDWVQGWTVRGPVSEVVVTVAGIVETTDTAGVLRGHRERVPVLAWLRQSALTRPDAALADLAAEGAGTDALALAHDLSARVADAIAWRPGTTDARTTAAEALARGEGVCQDHAHALIGAARARDLPARYVSGYMFTGGHGPAAASGTLSQSQSQASGGAAVQAATPADHDQDAAHAWAEIWIEGLGWVGFDPANRCCPDDRYIRLGSGLDAQGAAPIRGIARGQTAETDEALEVAVAVAAAQQ